MSTRAELRVAVESDSGGQPTQRIYLDGHELTSARRVRVNSEAGHRTASLDLELGAVSIDPRAVSEIRSVCGEDRVDIRIDADTVDGPVGAHLLPAWTRGQAPAHRRPDVFDRARDVYSLVVRLDWLVMLGVTYLTVTVLGVIFEDLILAYANGLRNSADDQ